MKGKDIYIYIYINRNGVKEKGGRHIRQWEKSLRKETETRK